MVIKELDLKIARVLCSPIHHNHRSKMVKSIKHNVGMFSVKMLGTPKWKKNTHLSLNDLLKLT